MTGSTRSPDSARLAGKYRLVEFIGSGGVGEVWRADNELLEVPVAVKLLRVRGGQDPKLAERMTREAQATARLSHPAIVKVFDFGTTDEGDPFLVMELLRGETLADLLERCERLPAIAAVQAVLPIAEALVLAHARGVVHRDIKPENVFLAETGGRIQPKLLDFGVARIAACQRRLTIDGTLVGTPEYMSPEQARAAELDYRSDIWSFCVLVYELVAGEPPFAGAGLCATLEAICTHSPEPLSAHVPGEHELWQILERGLARDPDARWPSMRELGRALARWLVARGVLEDGAGSSLETVWLGARPPPAALPVAPAPERARTLLAPLGVSFGIALALTLVLFTVGGAASPPERSEAARVLFADGSECRTVVETAEMAPASMGEPEGEQSAPPAPRPPRLRSVRSYDFGF